MKNLAVLPSVLGNLGCGSGNYPWTRKYRYCYFFEVWPPFHYSSLISDSLIFWEIPLLIWCQTYLKWNEWQKSTTVLSVFYPRRGDLTKIYHKAQLPHEVSTLYHCSQQMTLLSNFFIFKNPLKITTTRVKLSLHNHFQWFFSISLGGYSWSKTPLKRGK